MKNFFKRIRINFVCTSLLCIALGVLLILYPEMASTVLLRVVGGVLAICGILRIVGFLAGENATFGAKMMLVEGILLVLLGAFILIRPELIQELFSIIIGILLLIHAIIDFKEAGKLKQFQMKNWWIVLLIAIITAGLGVLLIWKPYEEFQKMVVLVGICLAADGLSDFVVYILWKHYERKARKAAKESGNAIIEVVDGKVK